MDGRYREGKFDADKLSEYSFGNSKFSPSWIIRVLNEGNFERKIEGESSGLNLSNM